MSKTQSQPKEAVGCLSALSPLDGRYAASLAPLRRIGSECGLAGYRWQAEIAWLKALCDEPAIKEARSLTADEQQLLDQMVQDFSASDAAAIKDIEAHTNHDVKAVEYYLKGRLKQTSMKDLAEFVHFACTSEDINNIAHALTARDSMKVLRPAREDIQNHLFAMAREHGGAPMISRTHGQPASPTTIGKEMAVFLERLRLASKRIDQIGLTGKFNGASGNYNAHAAAYPLIDWMGFSRRLLERDLGLRQTVLTTQIEPHDSLAELFHALGRWNTILLDLNRDIWQYISLGYFVQIPVAGEVGSSTMPHKVNPIDFENSEGNLGIANALLEHMAGKLPVSRMQRDLSDSTVLRNMGSAFGYCLLAYKSCRRGLGKIEINRAAMQQDLDSSWEVLAEAAQTVMRKAGLPDPYERMKELTRGKKITAKDFRSFIAATDLSEEDKQRLLDLSPATYTGLAAELAGLARPPE